MIAVVVSPISSTDSSIYFQSIPYANTPGNIHNLTLYKLCQKNRDKATGTNKANAKVKYSERAYQIMDFEEYETSLVEKITYIKNEGKEFSASDKRKCDDGAAIKTEMHDKSYCITATSTTVRRNLFTNGVIDDIREFKHSRPYGNMNGVAASSAPRSNGGNQF